jgi:hypothetical protein
MKPPTAFGRLLPRNDFEGDDYVPGAGGQFVSCQDTAAGRAVAWATNGRIDRDGREYRKVLGSTIGITIAQADTEVRNITGAKCHIVQPSGWGWGDVNAHLVAGRGLIMNGHYSTIPRSNRYQAFAGFNHSMWASHRSNASGIRLWDPLNPDTDGYGRWTDPAIIRAFVESENYYVGYVPLLAL